MPMSFIKRLISFLANLIAPDTRKQIRLSDDPEKGFILPEEQGGEGEMERTPAEQRQKERKRRRYELAFAAAAFVLVLGLTSLQLSQYRSGDRLFVIVFNVNFILLCGVLLVVLRNGFKLLLERRRRVLDSKIRTRLVLTFVVFSLLPCFLMFLVTTRYVQLSIDFWLNDEVETSMKNAFDIAGAFYDKSGHNLVDQARGLEKLAASRGLMLSTGDAEEFLSQKRMDYGLPLVGVIYPSEGRQFLSGVGDVSSVWENSRNEINWEELGSQGETYYLVNGTFTDYLVGIIKIKEGDGVYLLLGENMGPAFKTTYDGAVKASSEYRQLRRWKAPMKRVLFSSLGVLTAFIVLAAIWFGFRVAREITAPVIALAFGIQRIAKGDLSVRIDDQAKDELGMLVRSFNNMARDLEDSRQNLTNAYSMLEEQNLRIAGHNTYIRTILDNIAAGVISFDQDDRVSTANTSACEILRLDQSDLVGKRISSLFPGHISEIIDGMLSRFHLRPDMRTQHSVSLNLGGVERRLLINVVGFSTSGVYQGAVAVFEDISELERMQRMAAWREVARRIAHEIKNPLTPIKLSAQRLEKKFGPDVNDPAFSQSTQLIVRQVEHLQEMVQEFSAFAKLPEVRPVTGDIAPLLESLNALFQGSHSSISWVLRAPPNLPSLPMDKEALHRAFMNIYTNAVEALLLSRPIDPFVQTTVTHDTDLGLIRIDVADNGPGLTEEERSRLFEPYFSHKKGGTGLGLTIVKSIVSDHRGYVRAVHREGGGTVVSMELPLI